MKFTPRPHQINTIKFALETPRCNIWQDPGLGKTSIVLSALDLLWLAGSNKFPALVLGPKRVARAVWSREVNKWFDTFGHLEVSPIIGTEEQRIAALKKDVPIYTINYENIQWLVQYFGKGNWPFGIVVPDESTRLKGFRHNRGGKRAMALAKASKQTARWLNLTGTPAPNGLLDLWGQQWFVDGGARLGHTYGAFKDRWFVEDRYAHSIVAKPLAEEQIMSRLADVTLSLSARDVFPDLEEPMEIPIPVELPRKIRAIYDEFERELCFVVDNEPLIDAKNAADRTLKCLQLAAGAFWNEDRTGWTWLHDEKIIALQSLLEELNGNPLLVAYHFKHDLERLKRAFPEGKYLDTKEDEDRWNEGRYPIAFVHPGSAGHGLDLQYGGHNIAFFSHWWDLEQYQQVIERIGPVRQLQAGFQRKVGIYHIYAQNTMDEAVIARRREKTSMQDALRRLVAMRRLIGGDLDLV